MQRFRLGGLAFFSVMTLAGAQGYQMQSYLNLQGWQPAAAWCDTPQRVLAVTQPQGNTSPQKVKLVQWQGLDFSWQTYQYGPSDAGAGNLYTALTPAGQPLKDSPTYYVHSSNIENVSDPAYRMTHIDEFVVPAGRFRCRYQPQAIFTGATARHSVTVQQSGGSLTYISENRSGTPGVTLSGGTHLSAAGSDTYLWTKNGFTYALRLTRPGATLTVSQGQRTVQRETFQAYSLSTPRP